MAVFFFVMLVILPIIYTHSYVMPDSCTGQNFCTDKGDDYPDEFDLKEAVGSSSLYSSDEKPDLLESRQGHDYDFSCRGDINKGANVYYIKDKNGIVQAVVQLQEYLVQTYDIVQCNKHQEHKNCDDKILQSLQMKPNCTDQNMEFDFIILNSQMQLELIQANLPVCCKCTI